MPPPLASIGPVPVSPAAVSRPVVRRMALANLVANGAIVVTGGAVRLTGSGLGCPTWPRCTEDSFVATPELAAHGVIEFTNRTLTFVLTAVAVAALVVVFRSARRDLRPLAVLSFLGIPAQALLGGITVLTELNPWFVAAHFLVSAVLVALATTLWLRSREPGVGRPLLRRPFPLLATVIAVVTGAVALGGIAVLRADAPRLFDNLLGRALPLVVLSGLCGLASLLLVRRLNPRLVQGLAVVAVAAIVVGWGVAQYPYLLGTHLSIEAAAAPGPTLAALTVVAAAALVLVVPSMALLFVLSQRGRLEG